MGINDKSFDDFWDISKLVPAKKLHYGKAPDTKSADMEINIKKLPQNNDSDAVIKRYIVPQSSSSLGNMSFDTIDEYTPSKSLIHKVIIKKWNTRYRHYSSFLSDAIKYNSTVGEPCPYVPFYSYSPQYDQMDNAQLAYYFWFRENCRNEIFIKTDVNYLLLYIYELINLGERLNVTKTQYTLTELWNEYHKTFSAISVKLVGWICDYSILHKLPPPENAKSNIIKYCSALKEYFINMPPDDIHACSKSILQYCTSYDYHTSKFYKKETAELFDKYISNAICHAIKYYSEDGNVLSRLSSEDSMIERDVYSGALCVSEEKYRIEVHFCSFSCTNELRFLMGDVVKYSENRLRSFLGIKSKMTVYSISGSLKTILDAYFNDALPKKNIQEKKHERQEYDILYDIPLKKLSITDASKIEMESWETTKELLDAFEAQEVLVSDVTELPVIEEPAAPKIEASILEGFGEYVPLLISLYEGNSEAIVKYAKGKGIMSDAVVDKINELAFDIIGDLLIEEIENGSYVLIDDYKYIFINGETK